MTESDVSIPLSRPTRALVCSGIIDRDTLFTDAIWALLLENEGRAVRKQSGEATIFNFYRYNPWFGQEFESLKKRVKYTSASTQFHKVIWYFVGPWCFPAFSYSVQTPQQAWDDRMELLGRPTNYSPLAELLKPRILKFHQPQVEPFIESHPDRNAKSLPESRIRDTETVNEKLIEGEIRTVTTLSPERNPKARKQCLQEHGYRCAACDQNLEEIYGSLGREVIEVHHLNPLAKSRGKHVVDPIKDSRPVCPNCHTVIHSRKQPYLIDEIRSALQLDKKSKRKS
jgi:hypothetical protein